MKKVLATVAALGLVVGVTTNALALDKPGRVSESEATTAPRVAAPTAPGVALWSVAGQWALAGAYVSKGMGGPGGAAIQSGGGTESDSNDAWYLYSFKVLPVLQVNDKIAMKGEIRFVDRCISGTSCGSSASNRDADFKHVYMEWTSPWGKTRFGRTPAGAWGSKFINNTGQGDRLMWWLNMLPENWGSLIFTQKRAEVDSTSGPNVSDQDRDAYYVDLSYKADFGKTVGALWFDRRANASANLNDTITTSNLWVHGNYKWDAFALEYELNFAFGDGLPTSSAFDEAADQEGYGMYFDGSWKMQDWTFGGIFFLLSGDDNLEDNTNKALMSASGTGIDFNPTQILTGDYMGILNPDKGSVHPAIIQNGETNAGAWLLGGYAKFAMSPQLSFSADLSYAAATDEPNGWDDAYGTELGVGMSYKIMDNLAYSAHFAYLWTGDFFTEGGVDNSGIDTENVYLVAHALSMKF
jgi:hypothetical protein